MTRYSRPRRVESGGLAGFGCGFLLVVAFAFIAVDLTNLYAAAWTLGVAFVAAMIGAKYGDRFFSRVLETIRLLWWP